MALTLTPDDMIDLTGYKRGKDQCGWLSDRGWIFEVDAHGRPKVDADYYKRRMGGDSEAKPKRWQPDFSGVLAKA